MFMKKLMSGIILFVCLVLSGCTAEIKSAQKQSGEQMIPSLAQTTNAPDMNESNEKAFYEKTKAFILTGQESLPEAGRIKWAASFLDAVDFNNVYQSYLNSGAKPWDVEAFAQYLTENAKAPENWKELFEKALLTDYSQTPSRYEDLGNGYYQVYVQIDGAEVPYVTVNSRTGWYHG